MKGESIYKVPEGKLLKISLETDAGKIKAVRIKGDFFMHPEDGVELIEKGLAGQEINEGLVGLIDKIVEENSIELFGLDSESLAEAIKIAAGGKK